MRRLTSYALSVLFAVALTLAPLASAFAQNVPYNPASPIGNHLNGVPNATPAVSSCGTSPTIAGDDKAGMVTVGTGSPTACTITFFQAYNNAPYCVLSWGSILAAEAYTVSASGIAITQTGTSSDKITYHCIGPAGG